MHKNVFKVGNRIIGDGQPCFIIAEMSGNHNQNINRAYEIIEAASDAGVDAIKLQTYTPDTLTINCDNEYFRIGSTNAWAGQTLYDLYKTAHTPWDWQPKLKEFGEKKGLIVFSTPFDEAAIDFLETLHTPLYKVASFEANDIELLKKIGKTKKPVIVSIGLASLDDIQRAITTLMENGSPTIGVLHCVSSYPALPEQMNLAHITDIRNRFNVIVGLSDHSLGTEAAQLAVGEMKAAIIEKHFTLKRSDGGPDATFSLEPDEMKKLVNSIRSIEKNGFSPSNEQKVVMDEMRGNAKYISDKRESENIVFKRSLFVIKDININEELTKENIRSIRPGYGLSPYRMNEILGKRTKIALKRGTPLKEEYIHI